MDIYIGKGVLLGPLDQFEIKDFLSVNAPVLGNFRLSFSSIGFYLIINVLIVLILNNSATNYNKIVSNT
jgi:F-type H+-transporting ATPase subunit a